MKNTETIKELVRLLGLSTKERKVLEAIKGGHNTPLAIAHKTNISRPAIYAALKRFKNRGFVNSHIDGGKKYWSLASVRNIESALYDTKKFFLDISDGVEEVMGLSDSTIVIHRGKPAIQKLVLDIVKSYKGQRLYAIQGEAIVNAWNKVVGLEKINDPNRLIKKNDIITEMIFPFGWFEKQGPLLGKKWMEDFNERAAITHEIDEEYFQHAGQIWAFKNSLYLMAMNEEIVIEVRNSEIQKLLLSMFRFIQDNSRKIDVNRILRELLGIEKE